MPNRCRHPIVAGGDRSAPVLLPGLCIKQGLSPLLAVYQHGLMSGTPDLREVCADVEAEARLHGVIVMVHRHARLTRNEDSEDFGDTEGQACDTGDERKPTGEEW